MRSLVLCTLVLAATLAADDTHTNCPMHAQHTGRTGHDVDQRGDKVMGFSHEKTRHTFRLLADGGAIEVRALDGADAESIGAIRSHLKVIEKDFTSGTFAKPEEIHAKLPDGAEVMKELGSSIAYRYEELDGGARVRISTKDPRALDAVHRFLRFQIEDHRTGDATTVE